MITVVSLINVTDPAGVANEAPTLWVYCDGRCDAAGSHPRLPSEAHAMGFSEKSWLGVSQNDALLCLNNKEYYLTCSYCLR